MVVKIDVIPVYHLSRILQGNRHCVRSPNLPAAAFPCYRRHFEEINWAIIGTWMLPNNYCMMMMLFNLTNLTNTVVFYIKKYLFVNVKNH